MLLSNNIIKSESIIENRHKKCILEYNFLKNILLQNNYINDHYSKFLNEILIDYDIIKNPLYNSWIITIKDIIKSHGLNQGNEFSWKSILYTLDSNSFERIFDRLILELLAIRLFCDLEKLKTTEYQISTCLFNGFHIPLYYRATVKVKVKKISTFKGDLFINNKRIRKGDGCINDFKKYIYFYNDSKLKYLCNNIPSIIIDEKKIIKQDKIRQAFTILIKNFKNDMNELMKFIDCAYMIHSDEKMFYSGNDEKNLGLIYLPNINNEYYLAECILHEMMHQKLCNIEDIAQIFVGKRHLKECFYSPWRNDARPLRMILHGVFVFTAIIEFWNCFASDCQLRVMSIENCYLRLQQNKSAIKILNKHARFTKLGNYILQELITINNKYELNIKNQITNKNKMKFDIQISDHKKMFKMYVS